MQENPFHGRWKITEMELWDQKDFDLKTDGYFYFGEGDVGEFRFGLVVGEMDCRIENVCGTQRLEFSWEGQYDHQPALGRGGAVIKDGVLEGNIYFHMGDASWFKAKKMK